MSRPRHHDYYPSSIDSSARFFRPKSQLLAGSMGLQGYPPSPTDCSARFFKPKCCITWLDGLTDEEDLHSPKHPFEKDQGMVRKRQHLESSRFSDWNKILQEEFDISNKIPDDDSPDELAFEISKILERACKRDGGPSVHQLSRRAIFIWLIEHADVQLKLQKHLQIGRFDLAVYLLDESYHNSHNPGSVDPEIWGNLFRDWTGEYYGESLDALRQKLRDYESITQKSGTNYYSKSVAIIQSSGVGKSRLTSELGKDVFSLVFTLRAEGSTGYPPGDTEVYRFLTQERTLLRIHSRMFALLGSALQFVNEWLLGQNTHAHVGELARNWHNEMLLEPLPVGENPKIDTRSKARRTFCAKVVSDAEKLYEVFSKDNELVTTINNAEYEKLKDLKVVKDYLQKPAADFLNAIKIAHTTDHIPLAVWVFDEVASLDPPGTDATRFAVLRRVTQSLEAYPFWALFLSTNSSVHRFAAPKEVDSSDGIKKGDLLRFPPFFALPIDLELGRRMNDRELRQQELKKPISQFSSGKHMAMFGRPLWYAYANLEPAKIKEFVTYKLLYGEWRAFGHKNHKNQVFALLASRLCLDPCMNSKEAIQLAQDAVDFHLRLITGYNSEQGLISTTTPSEPIVADAAADVLMRGQDSPPGEYIWTRAILTLANELLSKGLVSKGIKGELYARLIFVLTCDFTRENAIKRTEPEPFPFSQPFSVTDFFKQLFGKRYETDIAHSDFNRPLRTRQKAPNFLNFAETFGGASLNFTHFSFANERLPRDGEIGQMLLHQLLRRNQALQLSEHQEHWDLLIPMYFGACDEDFDTSKVSAILIQVKNRLSRNVLPTRNSGEIKDRFPITQPIIQILLDLGVDRDELDCSYCASPTIYSITARGGGQETFGCLSQESRPGLANACMRLLDLNPLSENDLCEEIVRHNIGVQFPKRDTDEKEDSDGESGSDSKSGGEGYKGGAGGRGKDDIKGKGDHDEKGYNQEEGGGDIAMDD